MLGTAEVRVMLSRLTANTGTWGTWKRGGEDFKVPAVSKAFTLRLRDSLSLVERNSRACW